MNTEQTCKNIFMYIVCVITSVNSMVTVICLADGMKYFVVVASKTQEDVNLKHFPSCYLLVQTQQRKHQKKI